MKKLSKLLPVVLALAMILGSLAACSSTPAATATVKPADQTKAAETASAVAEATATTPAIVTLQIVCDPQWDTDVMTSDEYKIWNGFANKAGFNLDFIAIPHANYVEKLDVMFASGDVGDMVWCWGLSDRISSGYLLPIETYLNGDFSDLKEKTGEINLAGVTTQGHIWSYPLPSNEGGALMGFMIRQDWLTNLNLAVPTTTDELAAVLHAFTYNDPDGNKANDTYGASFRKDLSWFDLYGAFGMSNYVNIKLDCDLIDGKLVQQVTEQKYYDFLKFMRTLWADGVFDPNSFLNTGSQWTEVWSSGKAGVICHYSANAHTYFTPTLQSVSGNSKAQFDAILTLKGPYGQNCNMDAASGGVLAVTTKCQYPEKAMEYIRWLLNPTDEMQNFVRWGVEGKHFITINGIKYRNPGTWNGADNEYASLGSADLFEQNIKPNMDNIGYFEYWAKFTDDPTYISAIYGSYGQRVLESNAKNNQPNNILLQGKPELPEEMIKADIQAAVLEHMVKIITGAEDLDAGWKAMQDELKTIGIDTMTAAWQKWYDENKK